MGIHAADEARLIGQRSAEMHLALAAGMGKDMKPEAFSLHYQRSLYSSITSLVRETYENLARHKQASLLVDGRTGWIVFSPIAPSCRVS